jgi:hypothetical protein
MEELASRQWGVVSQAQLRSLGFSDDAIERRVRAGRLITVHARTFTLAGVPRSWEQQVTAAQIWAGDDSILSHRTAAVLWELDGVERSTPELTTARCLRPRPSVLVYRKRLAPGDVRSRNDFRLTSIPRTLLDLGAVLPSWAVELAFEGALHRRLTSIEQLRKQLASSGGRGVRGSQTFAALLTNAMQNPLAQSRLEKKLGAVLSRLGVPAPHAQYEVRDSIKLVARVDFAYPEKNLAIEATATGFTARSANGEETSSGAPGWRGWAGGSFTSRGRTSRDMPTASPTRSAPLSAPVSRTLCADPRI